MMKILERIPTNFNLRKKITILMLAVFLAGIVFSGFICYHIFMDYARNQLNTEANILISTIDSVRNYNNKKISPLLRESSEREFLVESIPTYAVSEVFRILTSVYKDQYGSYLYKNAMLNPSAPRDRATDEEVKIIETLRQQEKSTEQNLIRGYLTVDGQQKFYIARPIILTDKSCLRCHSSLEKAPKSLQVWYQKMGYAPELGMGWELNKIIGTKIIYVPSEQVYKTAMRNFIPVIVSLALIFTSTIYLVNFWLKRYVVQPLSRITQAAEAVSLGDMDANFEKKSEDEVGRLAEAFTRLKTSLAIALKRLNKLSN